MTGQLGQIEATLERYFDALYDSDASLLGQVMHPQAIYVTADEPQLLIRTMEEYLPIVAARASPRSRREARSDVVEAIDVAGDNTAMARVRCSIGKRDFTDFLSLVKTPEGWRIIAKVFHFNQRED